MTDFNALADSSKAAAQSTALIRGMSPERWAERSAAYVDREAREQQLRTLKATEPTAADREAMADAQSLQLQNAVEQLKQLQYENNRQTSFRAFEAFDSDGDLRHINNMLADFRKSGSTMFARVARVDPITSMDFPELDKLGIPPQMQKMMVNDPILSKSYLKVTETDGTVTYRSMDELKGANGYLSYASAKELKRVQDAALQQQLIAMGYEADETGLEAYRRAINEFPPNTDPRSPEVQEAITKHYNDLIKRGKWKPYGAKGSGSGTGEERYAIRYVEEVLNIKPGEPGYDEAVLQAQDDFADSRRRPAMLRNLDSVDIVEDELLEMNFLDLDLNDLTQTERAQIERKIRRIERAGGAELDAAAKSKLMEIRKFSTLGTLASELTPEQTGIIDNLLFDVKKYLFDNVENTTATSAYQTISNFIMHTLYGATLQPGEQKRFLKATGSLAQQRGPVLEQLRVALQGIKDDYEVLAELNNEFVMKWRTGQTEASLNNMLIVLDERIKYVQSVKGSSVAEPYTTITAPEQASKGILTPELEAAIDADLNSITKGPTK